MNDTVISTATFIENFHEYIKTPTVKIRYDDDIVILTPQPNETKYPYGCTFFGTLSSPVSMSDKLIAQREVERANSQ
jgi:hypothetical protein